MRGVKPNIRLAEGPRKRIRVRSDTVVKSFAWRCFEEGYKAYDLSRLADEDVE